MRFLFVSIAVIIAVIISICAFAADSQSKSRVRPVYIPVLYDCRKNPKIAKMDSLTFTNYMMENKILSYGRILNAKDPSEDKQRFDQQIFAVPEGAIQYVPFEVNKRVKLYKYVFWNRDEHGNDVESYHYYAPYKPSASHFKDIVETPIPDHDKTSEPVQNHDNDDKTVASVKDDQTSAPVNDAENGDKSSECVNDDDNDGHDHSQSAEDQPASDQQPDPSTRSFDGFRSFPHFYQINGDPGPGLKFDPILIPVLYSSKLYPDFAKLDSLQFTQYMMKRDAKDDQESAPPYVMPEASIQYLPIDSDSIVELHKCIFFNVDENGDDVPIYYYYTPRKPSESSFGPGPDPGYERNDDEFRNDGEVRDDDDNEAVDDGRERNDDESIKEDISPKSKNGNSGLSAYSPEFYPMSSSATPSEHGGPSCSSSSLSTQPTARDVNLGQHGAPSFNHPDYAIQYEFAEMPHNKGVPLLMNQFLQHLPAHPSMYHPASGYQQPGFDPTARFHGSIPMELQQQQMIYQQMMMNGNMPQIPMNGFTPRPPMGEFPLPFMPEDITQKSFANGNIRHQFMGGYPHQFMHGHIPPHMKGVLPPPRNGYPQAPMHGHMPQQSFYISPQEYTNQNLRYNGHSQPIHYCQHPAYLNPHPEITPDPHFKRRKGDNMNRCSGFQRSPNGPWSRHKFRENHRLSSCSSSTKESGSPEHVHKILKRDQSQLSPDSQTSESLSSDAPQLSPGSESTKTHKIDDSH